MAPANHQPHIVPWQETVARDMYVKAAFVKNLSKSLRDSSQKAQSSRYISAIDDN